MSENENSPADGLAVGQGPPRTSRSLGTVISNRPMGGMRHLDLQVPGWKTARPGQFVLLQAVDSDCFLGRALSVSDQSGDTVTVLVAPVGKGTRELCSLEPESAVWVLGPLGNGFDLASLQEGAGRIVLVGGGAGIAPFPLLVRELGRAEGNSGPGSDSGLDIVVLAGFRDSQQSMCSGTLAKAVAEVGAGGRVCTYEAVMEDASAGKAERASDLLKRTLRRGDHVVVCGPEAMAKAVWDVCRPFPDVRGWFSMETNMACGVGSCHGCVIPLADGSFARVCREGPVFTGEELFGG